MRTLQLRKNRSVARIVAFVLVLASLSAPDALAQFSESAERCLTLLKETGPDPVDVSPDGRYRPRWWDVPPPDASAFASQRVKGKQLSVVLLPSDASAFERVFDRPPSMAELQEMKAQAPTAAVTTPATATEDSLARILTATDATFVSFIGHNDRGMLRFPDGSKMRLFDIARLCAKHGKRAIFLSCRSENYTADLAVGTAGELSFAEALTLSSRLAAYFAKIPSTSLADVQAYLRTEERAVAFSYKVKYLVTRLTAAAGVSSVLALVVYVVEKVVAEERIEPTDAPAQVQLCF